jgi:hypothetical protein
LRGNGAQFFRPAGVVWRIGRHALPGFIEQKETKGTKNTFLYMIVFVSFY